MTLAQDAIVLHETQGSAAALETLRKRRGGIYDPRMVDVFLRDASTLTRDLDAAATWDHVLSLEPEPRAQLTHAELDEALTAMADFADIKSPFTFGHSRAVAALAMDAARRLRLPERDVTTLRRAALVHDIGQAAISSGVLAKRTSLSDSERERVRMHTYHAERILARPPLLARLAEIVAHHHERIDGSGYHRGARGADLSPAAKILAAAEAYQAMIEARPHRAAMTREEAARTLRRDVRDGRLDAEAVNAVLEAGGHEVPPIRRDQIGGLTARETEILRLIAGGKTAKQMGAALGISAKTADNHIQNLYAKIGVRTRAGATLYAIEHGLFQRN